MVVHTDSTTCCSNKLTTLTFVRLIKKKTNSSVHKAKIEHINSKTTSHSNAFRNTEI